MGTFTVTRQISQSVNLISANAETVIWANSVLVAGGFVSGSRFNIVDGLVSGLKLDGVWSKLDRLWLFAAENTQSALVDLVAVGLATAVGSPTFATDRGYTGTDAPTATNYIDAGFNLSTANNYKQNAAHTSCWVNTSILPPSAGSAYGCVTGGTAGTYFTSYNWDGFVYGEINDTSAPSSQGAAASKIGHWVVNRSGASASQVYQNGSLFSSPNATSSAVQNGNLYVLARNTIGTGPRDGTPNQIGMLSVGGNLTSTDITKLYNRLRTYMTAVGVP